jgi:ABC-type multidrug transport system fused ATPase/permease subunit
MPPLRRKKLALMTAYSVFSAVLDVGGITLLVFTAGYVSEHADTLNHTEILTGSTCFLVFFILKNWINSYLTRRQASFAFSEALMQSTTVFNKIHNKNELFFRKAETGALISDIMYVPASFANGVILGYITLITEMGVLLLMILFLLVSSFYVSVLVFLFVAPAAFFAYRSVRNKVEALGNDRNNNVKKAQDALIQGMQGHTDALLYNRTGYFRNFFSQYQEKISTTDALVFSLNSLPARLMELFAVLALCIIFVYTRLKGESASLPFSITLFVASAFRLLPSINRSLGSLLRIRNHWFAVDTLKMYHSDPDPEVSNDALLFNDRITVEGLGFGYDLKEICRIHSFTLLKGSCIGIYGNTGEGKSTFIQLFLGLIPSKEGLFTVDGQEVESASGERYRRLFAYIRQDVFVLNASLAENIALGSEEVQDIERLNAIVRRLELEKIGHLFSGEDINAGEAGNKLSGGQRKLVALARALYFEKPVLVLDETLASLDDETTGLVLNVLREEHRKGKTILIVSHLKKVFEICDAVFEFKSGTLHPETKHVQTI